MVTVKRIGGGLFSNWVGDQLKAGDTVDVMPPHGSFTTEFDAVEAPPPRRHRRRLGHHAGHVADQDDAARGAEQPLHLASTAIATAAR